MGQIISALILVSFVAGALAFNTIEQSRLDNPDCERNTPHSVVLDIQPGQKPVDLDQVEIPITDLSDNTAIGDTIEQHMVTSASTLVNKR